MWKIIFLSYVILTFNSYVVADEKNNHLSEAKIQFPYSLIGYDFGILNADDLAIPTCHVLPKPYSNDHGDDGTNAIYWKCFSTNQIQVECDKGKYDPSERTILTGMGIVIKNDQEINEYIARRAIPLKSCKSWQRDWKRLSKDQLHACFSGFPSGKKLVLDNGRQTQKYYWIFESYKTHLGCSSYFAEGCNLQHQIKHGCKTIVSD